MPEYRIKQGTPQEAFGHLRTKVQIFGGGYGNGKTAAAVVQKALRLARDYPGSNGLIARSTYPKLNDTIRKEFIKWTPPSWIKSFPLSKNSDNTCTFKNNSTINFRYIAQQGKAASDGEHTTSNLLSATYDWIIVDQLEDPEITRKDFEDLMGRLRGSTKYIGTDQSMPRTGPRWFIGCVNPTRNWVYRTLVAPLKLYQQTGIIDDELLCEREPRDINGHPNPNAGKPILDKDGKPTLLIALVEGSTYTNAHNLDPDFISTLESVYSGQMSDRYLYGEWASYEGLVHPDFDDTVHLIPRAEMRGYYEMLISHNVVPEIIESYDFGITSPSCYLLAFVDRRNNVFVYDGFYKPEEKLRIDKQQKLIHEMRNELGVEDGTILADPAIFRRTIVQQSTGAKTIARLFSEGSYGVKMRTADNEINRGILKVNMYLTVSERHKHPTRDTLGAPHIFFASELDFIQNEFAGYFWKSNSDGSRQDIPIDKNDHAMNAIKYLLSRSPDIAQRIRAPAKPPYLTQWSIVEQPTAHNKAHRYG